MACANQNKSKQLARLKKELDSFDRSPPTGISLIPLDEELQNFEAQIVPGSDTPYKDGIFKLHVYVPNRYPFEPPQMRFDTPIYHPNIDSGGRICLEVFNNAKSWSPTMSIEKILLGVQALLAEPNPDDPLVPQIADEYKNNRPLYEEKAKNHTKIHATQSLILNANKETKELNEIIDKVNSRLEERQENKTE